MPQFFFDFRQDGERSPDREGLELATAEEAYLEAFQGAREMWAELMAKRQDPRRCSFEVRDAGAELLFILPFQEVLDSCQHHAPPPQHDSFTRATHTANRAKRACQEFSAQLHSIRKTLEESRSLLLAKV